MESISAALAPERQGRGRFGFAFKILLAFTLVAVADAWFYRAAGGSTLGAFAFLLLTAALLARPVLRRSPAGLVAAGAAACFAFALFADPSLLAAALFWAAASMAVLLPKAGFDDGWRWAQRLGLQLAASPVLPLRDLGRLRAARRRRPRVDIGAKLPMLGLPLIGSLVFLALFARANPLIDDALAGIAWGRALSGLSLSRIAFWLALTMLAWSLLRPTRFALAPRRATEPFTDLPGVSLASVTLSLIAFNAIFALQNGLDLVFLWSGAPLPAGLTLAEYAHRGAYPLIATALLAGLFVLVTLRPGSAMAASRPLRLMVSLWIGQNVLLVASTILRTLDYIDAYSLTVLRISALLWMGLVALGLVLICWRLWRGRSGAWLINANLLAATLLLTACAFVDLGAAAAAWNVRHAREAGGPGAGIDLCYLDRLGESALLPVIEMESRRIGPVLDGRLAWLRNHKLAALEARQADWRRWTVRGARRLAVAREQIAEHRLPRFAAEPRACGGVPPRPRVVVPASTARGALTARAALTGRVGR